MNQIQTVNRPVVIRRGKFTVNANDGELGPPGNGATITLYDANATHNGVGNQRTPVPFSRLLLTIFADFNSGVNGVVYSENLNGDGTTYETISTQTYTAAATAQKIDILLVGSLPKITYTNSANVLTKWEFTLMGLFDRDDGVAT